LNMIWLERWRVVDDNVMRGSHSPLTNVLTHKEEVVPEMT
jgi:hypothetical protein